MSEPRVLEAWEIAEVVQLFKIESHARFVEKTVYDQLVKQRDDFETKYLECKLELHNMTVKRNVTLRALKACSPAWLPEGIREQRLEAIRQNEGK